MSEFKFNCPHCDQPLAATEDMLGQTLDCPSCNGAIQLPEPQVKKKQSGPLMADLTPRQSPGPDRPMQSQQKQMVGVAVASLILGIAGMLLGPLGAIPAVICGHIARSRIKQNQDVLTGNGMALAGLILGYIQIGVMFIVFPLSCMAGIAVPSFLQYREDTQSSLCVNNLRLVAHAKEVVAIKHAWTDGYRLRASDIAEINSYLEDAPLSCPVGTATDTYFFNRIGEDPVCPLNPNGEHTL